MATFTDRFAALPAAPLEDRLALAAGALRDYHALAEHHYKARQPATATRVLVLRDDRPSVTDRFLQHPGEPTIVGVLVESLPSLSCRMRDAALDQRYGSLRNPWQRAQLLNAEVRCISRVVVHPQWRGLGLAVRLVRHALATATTPYTEALAAMGRVSPFFIHAGMTAYPRPSHAFDARLRAALASCGLAPRDLAHLSSLLLRLEALPDLTRRWFFRELLRWFRRNHGRAHVYVTDPRYQLQVARQRLLSEPVYFFHHHHSQSQS